MPAAIALAVGAIFICTYLAAFHAPRPHRLPVAVVGSAAEGPRVRAQLTGQPQDAFALRTLPQAASARLAVERGELYAAYIPAGDHPQLLYAGAHGPSVASLLTSAFEDVAQADGSRLSVVDVAPASPGDTRGLVVFYTAFGLVMAGYLFGNTAYHVAPHLSINRRLAGLALFSTCGGLVVAAIVHTGFDALPAPFLGIVGLVALTAAAVVSWTMLLVRKFAAAGSSIAAVVFMILGNATSGGTLPPQFLPAWLQPLSSSLPVGVGVHTLNGLAYFHNAGLGRGIAVLSAWALTGAGLLYLVDHRLGPHAPTTSMPSRAPLPPAAQDGSDLTPGGPVHVLPRQLHHDGQSERPTCRARFFQPAAPFASASRRKEPTRRRCRT